jgi:hypothetical protein
MKKEKRSLLIMIIFWIINDLPHKSGDIYLSKGSFQDGWVFAYTLISSKIMLRIR